MELWEITYDKIEKAVVRAFGVSAFLIKLDYYMIDTPTISAFPSLEVYAEILSQVPLKELELAIGAELIKVVPAHVNIKINLVLKEDKIEEIVSSLVVNYFAEVLKKTFGNVSNPTAEMLYQALTALSISTVNEEKEEKPKRIIEIDSLD